MTILPGLLMMTKQRQSRQVLGEDGEPVYVTSFDVKARILKILSSYYYFSNSYILRPIVGSEEFYDYGDEGDIEIETPSDTETDHPSE
jgi:hypothetical protein